MLLLPADSMGERALLVFWAGQLCCSQSRVCPFGALVFLQRSKPWGTVVDAARGPNHPIMCGVGGCGVSRGAEEPVFGARGGAWGVSAGRCRC